MTAEVGEDLEAAQDDLTLIDDLEIANPEVSEPDVVSAVGRLMDSQRAVTDQEILLAGVIELLGRGASTMGELLERMQAVWPGSGLTRLRIQAAVDRGESARLVVRSSGLMEEELWSLTPEGQLELAGTRTWRQDMYDRVAEQLRVAAREAFGADPGFERAVRWAHLLRRAVGAGVRGTMGVYSGEVESVDSAALLPRAVDRDAMLAALDAADARPEVLEFLRACALAALDPTDVFGTELVTNIVTGCVLHAAVARRDQHASQKRMGLFKGQRAVLDTPVLLFLLGPRTTADPAGATVRAAVEAGIEVVVADHTLEEFLATLEYAGEVASKCADSSMSVAETLAYGRLVDNEVVTMYAEALAEGRYRTWADFKTAATSMRAELLNLGVICRPHYNRDSETVAACRRALVDVLDKRQKRRGQVNIDRDAETMAMTWRARRRRKASDGAWPGGWVITTDTCLTPAMRTVEKGTRWPFALSLSQFAALLTRCGDVPSVADLARATATLIAQEAAESLACRYPPAVAVELARALAVGGSATDVRVAQTLDQVFSTVDGEDAAVVTSRVMAHRQRRMNDAHAITSKTLSREVVSAREQAQRKNEQAESERNRNQALSIDLRNAEDRSKALQEKLKATEEQSAAERATQIRRRKADVAVAVHALIVVVFVYTGHYRVAVLIAVSAVLFWERLRSWVETGHGGVVRVAISALPDVIGVGVWLWDVLGG